MSFGYNILGFGSGAAGAAPYNVQFLVVAGGGSGGNEHAGGGGAGGYRIIASKAHEVIPCTAYPITVGAGGAQMPAPPSPPATGNPGGTSVFDTITSAGGGGGGGAGSPNPPWQGLPGGYGGGGAADPSGPPTTDGG